MSPFLHISVEHIFLSTIYRYVFGNRKKNAMNINIAWNHDKKGRKTEKSFSKKDLSLKAKVKTKF